MPDWLTLTVDQTNSIDIPGGWATVLVAFLTTIVGPITVLLVQQSRMNHRVKETQAQVVNSHDNQPNLREDIDEIKAGMREVHAGQHRHELRLDEQSKDIRGIREDIGQLRQTERAQWAAIEQTRPTVRPNRSTNKKEQK